LVPRLRRIGTSLSTRDPPRVIGSATCRSRSEQTGPSSDSRSAAISAANRVEPSNGNRAAMAIRTDPAPTASVGDPIEVWTSEEDSSRPAATGMVRATAEGCGDDHSRRRRRRPTRRFRLELSTDDAVGTAERRRRAVFCARAADETVRSVLSKTAAPWRHFVGWLSGIVLVAVRDGEVIPFPDDNETFKGRRRTLRARNGW